MSADGLGVVPDELSSKTTMLDRVLVEFRKVLDMPDPSQIYTMLGAMAANRLKNEPPVWLIIIGPPSSGKSEPLKYFAELPDMHSYTEVTQGGLLSCSPKKEKKADSTGGILKSIGDYGILLISDMSPTLSMGPEQLGKFLSIMREVYDGKVVRGGGQDGGMTVRWKGKLGLIAAATGAIDRHHSIINELGDRYLYFRMPKTDVDTKLDMADLPPADKAPIVSALLALVSSIDYKTIPALSPDNTKMLKSLAKFVSHTRTATIRDGVSRKLEHLNDPEEPVRLYKSFRNLFRGLLMVGVETQVASELICKIALDTIPPARLAVLRPIVTSTEPVAGTDILAVPGFFSETTLRRALEDLESYKVIVKNGVNGHPSSFSKSSWLIDSLADLPLAGFSEISSFILEKKKDGGGGGLESIGDKSEKLGIAENGSESSDFDSVFGPLL